MKKLHAKISNDGKSILETKILDTNNVPTRNELGQNKPYWVPVIDEINDNSTGAEEGFIEEYEQNVIEEGRVVNRTIKRDKTPSELIESEQKSKSDGEQALREICHKPMFYLLLKLTNEIQILNGNTQYTKESFIEYLQTGFDEVV